jgi:glucans biosynthesis protein
MRVAVIRLLVLLVVFLGTSHSTAQASEFFDKLIDRAQHSATQAYTKEAPVPDTAKLGYDAYRGIRFRPESILWRDSGSFHVEFFPTGFLYQTPVKMYVIRRSPSETAVGAIALSPSPEMFDFGTAKSPASIGFAGFKITSPLNGQKFDEVVSFLGASYFRPIGKGQAYGASARGLAVDTAQPRSEEFPEFREFWLVEPAPGDTSMTIYALLESPGASGAYAFTVTPGARTTIDVDARLFMRHGVSMLGVAPLTSMFLSGKSGPWRDDFRPEVHDSDGLALLTGEGKRIWRPLRNPDALQVSSFVDNNPRGFGLQQRERRFDRYQDGVAKYEARPSLWVEPKGDWGEGEVRLVEIPTPSEYHDNIVAFWVSRWPVEKGAALEYRYRLSALSDEAALLPEARVVATRQSPVDGNTKARRLVVEFEGDTLARLPEQRLVESNVEVSGGKLLRAEIDRTPGSTNRRLFIDVEPESRRAAEIRAYLTVDGKRLSETLSIQLRP